MSDREDRMEEALHRIAQWADAYPVDIFPRVDLAAARAKLGDDNLFSRLHAEWARHITEKIGQIARAAMEATPPVSRVPLDEGSFW